VDSNEAVSRYLSKYVTKEGEIYFSNNLPDVTAGLVRLWSVPTLPGTLPVSETPQD